MGRAPEPWTGRAPSPKQERRGRGGRRRERSRADRETPPGEGPTRAAGGPARPPRPPPGRAWPQARTRGLSWDVSSPLLRRLDSPKPPIEQNIVGDLQSRPRRQRRPEREPL